MDRAVIHLNVADFAVSVERLVDARLRHRPVIVAPGGIRAAVYDMSEEAFRAGVRKGMPMARAVRVCRDAAVLPPRPARYEQAMAAVCRLALPFSPLIESGEDDGHLFVDVTASGKCFGPPVDMAWRMQREARKHLGLDPIWAVAPNKLTAKVATRTVKPAGESIVGAGEEADFLEPLPLGLLPGIAPSDLARFRDFNLDRVADVLILDAEQMQVAFGRRGQVFYEIVRGIDPSPVTPLGLRPPRVTADHAFGDDTNDERVLDGVLYRLVETAGTGLRERRMAARRIGVALDYADGVRCVRQRSSSVGTADDPALYALARSAFRLARTRRVRIRHVRLVCDRLVFPSGQIGLFDDGRNQKQARLGSALDAVRRRFGRDAVRVGRTLAA
jgi:DNA polymerase-4